MSNNIIKRVLQTIVSGLFGIQSHSNMEKDFEVGKPKYYIVAGIITVVIILLTLYNIVKYVVR